MIIHCGGGEWDQPNIPKCLANIGGKSVLARIFDKLDRLLCEDVVVLAPTPGGKIIQACQSLQNVSAKKSKILISSSGNICVQSILSKFQSALPTMILVAEMVTEDSLETFVEQSDEFSQISVLAKYVESVKNSDRIRVDSHNANAFIQFEPNCDSDVPGYVSAGAYIVQPNTFESNCYFSDLTHIDRYSDIQLHFTESKWIRIKNMDDVRKAQSLFR